MFRISEDCLLNFYCLVRQCFFNDYKYYGYLTQSQNKIV